MFRAVVYTIDTMEANNTNATQESLDVVGESKSDHDLLTDNSLSNNQPTQIEFSLENKSDENTEKGNLIQK